MNKRKKQLLLIVSIFILGIVGTLLLMYNYNLFETFHSDLKNSDPKNDSLYIIYSIGNSEYQEWQADLLDFSYLISNQPGTLIRLVSDDSPILKRRRIPRSKIGHTIVTPDFSKINSHTTVPYMNKSGSVHYFLKNLSKQFLRKNKNSVCIFLDPDMVFTKPWDPRTLFKPGQLYGQKWKGYAQNFCTKSCPLEYCPKEPNKTYMYPFATYLCDAVKYFPDIKNMSLLGYKKNPKNWMLEMSTHVAGVVKNGIDIIGIENIGLCNDWNNKNDQNAPIVHYCQIIKNNDGEYIWGKRTYNKNFFDLNRKKFDPKIPHPSEATNRVDKEVLLMLQKYIEYQNKSNHFFK